MWRVLSELCLSVLCKNRNQLIECQSRNEYVHIGRCTEDNVSQIKLNLQSMTADHLFRF